MVWIQFCLGYYFALVIRLSSPVERWLRPTRCNRAPMWPSRSGSRGGSSRQQRPEGGRQQRSRSARCHAGCVIAPWLVVALPCPSLEKPSRARLPPHRAGRGTARARSPALAPVPPRLAELSGALPMLPGYRAASPRRPRHRPALDLLCFCSTTLPLALSHAQLLHARSGGEQQHRLVTWFWKKKE